jgi:RimJ/RimL family protein N-acetyltransferase
MSRQIQQDGYRYYQIIKDEQPIGYTAVQIREDAIFLSKLYILKAHRGNGYARKSLEFIESLARENSLRRITLTCNKYNTGTIKAYEKMGFTNTGSIVMDIGGGFVMDDYTLEKPVD